MALFLSRSTVLSAGLQHRGREQPPLNVSFDQPHHCTSQVARRFLFPFAFGQLFDACLEDLSEDPFRFFAELYLGQEAAEPDGPDFEVSDGLPDPGFSAQAHEFENTRH